MQIRFLEANGRHLLTCLHSSPRLRARSAAVLLCNPFGEEAVRAHRSFRVLADRLEQAGYASLRFDYAGTGDSSGEIEQYGIDDWAADIASCAAELQASSGAPRLVLVGLRFGAALAAHAASRHNLALRHLVLWDPVVDGAALLEEMDRAHAIYMREEVGADGWRDNRPVGPDDQLTEALGTSISRRLAAELAQIQLWRDPPQVDHLSVVGARHSDAIAKLRERLPDSGNVRWIDTSGAGSWNSDAALNAAIVPMEEVLAIVARVEALSP